MSIFKDVADLLDPQTWATYIVGAVAIGVGLWQFRRAFKLNKKSQVFDELSKELQEASVSVSNIQSQTTNIIDHLAQAANSADFDLAGKTQAEQTAEIERRIEELDNIAEKQKEYLTSIYNSSLKILKIINKVEKSSVVSDSSRKAARYLFYEATEQHELLVSMSKILQSFNVTPPVGQAPNITSNTFNAFMELVHKINARNIVIGNYINDLETILHNDLVKKIFGKASIEKIPTKHLTPTGLTDTRVKDSLL
jgi:hypothetical protein